MSVSLWWLVPWAFACGIYVGDILATWLRGRRG